MIKPLLFICLSVCKRGVTGEPLDSYSQSFIPGTPGRLEEPFKVNLNGQLRRSRLMKKKNHFRFRFEREALKVCRSENILLEKRKRR